MLSKLAQRSCFNVCNAIWCEAEVSRSWTGKQPVPADSWYMPGNSMLRHLVDLACSSTGAESAELVILGDPEFRLLAGDREIGGHQSWTEKFHLNGDVTNVEGVAEGFASLLTIPVTGPSAESGWIAVAHRDPGVMTSSSLDSLSLVATLVEERLDRTVERIRLDQLGSVLRANQQDLKVARDKLAATNTELEQFAYIAAHELVSPLRSVAIYAEVLEGLVPDDESDSAARARQCAEAIRSGVTAMNQQVQYLLEFSRAEGTAASVEAVDLTHVVSSALDTLSEPLDEANAIVMVDDLPTVQGREAPLQSVFANLIKNAVNYRHPDRRLELKISSTSSEGNCRITLADNGVGVEAGDRSRVFQLFERASTESPGTGIGLALSRRIVEAHGGEIGIEEGSPVGSVLWMELPEMSAA